MSTWNPGSKQETNGHYKIIVQHKVHKQQKPEHDTFMTQYVTQVFLVQSMVVSHLDAAISFLQTSQYTPVYISLHIALMP